MAVSFAGLQEGDQRPALELEPRLGQVIRYLALGWVFPEFFFDPEAAKAQGMPGTLVPGPLKLGLLYRCVAEWLGPSGFVREVRAAHRRPDLTGKPITIAGRIARLYQEDGSRRADLELAIINAEGQPSVRGFAVVQFFESA